MPTERFPVIIKIGKKADIDYNQRGAELTKLFKSGRGKFLGIDKTYQSLEETNEPTDLPPEKQKIETSIKKELNWFKEFFASAVNLAIAKEQANLTATANITIFGTTYEGIPATALINLEKKLVALKNIFSHLPTLSGTTNWIEEDPVDGIKKLAAPTWAYRTEKRRINHIKSPETKNHPQQVDVCSDDVRVGKWITMHYSGEITSQEKSAILHRVDQVIECVVKAREDANNITVKMTTIGDQIYDQIIEEFL